jgi:hypothetical protein
LASFDPLSWKVGVGNCYSSIRGSLKPRTRFASWEALRWLEWGTRSYQEFTIGLALVLLALVIVWTARITRPIGYVMGLSGLAFIVQGWVVGTEGFSLTNGVMNNISGLSTIIWIIWLLIVALRMKESVQATPA